MRYLIAVCLIIVSISLISCSGIIQPQERGQSQPITTPPPLETPIITIITAVIDNQATKQSVVVTNNPNNSPPTSVTIKDHNVKIVTALPQKVVIPPRETTVVHSTSKSVIGIISLSTPTPYPTPIWIDNEIVIVNPRWHDTLQLQVGQQLAIISLPYKKYGWELSYDTNILESVSIIGQSKIPEAGWLWTAKKEGETTIKLQSIVPTQPPCETMVCPLGDVITTKKIKVKVTN